jgi:hypothetical protein
LVHEADRAWCGAGNRGAVALKLSVRTSSSDLHSGSYGGSVANAAHVLSSLLAELHRPEDGAVAAPRFYDDVAPLSPEQRAAFEALALNETEDKAAAGALLACFVFCSCDACAGGLSALLLRRRRDGVLRRERVQHAGAPMVRDALASDA